MPAESQVLSGVSYQHHPRVIGSSSLRGGTPFLSKHHAAAQLSPVNSAVSDSKTGALSPVKLLILKP